MVVVVVVVLSSSPVTSHPLYTALARDVRVSIPITSKSIYAHKMKTGCSQGKIMVPKLSEASLTLFKRKGIFFKFFLFVGYYIIYNI